MVDTENNFNPDDHMVLIGFGDVGRRVAGVLHDENVNFIIIDTDHGKLKDSEYNYIIGDGVDEETLKRAGLETAHTVIITLGSDTNAIFSTLVARNLNPHAIMLVRANHQPSIDKIYKAGADYVASLPSTAGQMLTRLTLTEQESEEMILMYEGIMVEKYKVTHRSPLKNKSIIELNLIETTGCSIIGIQEGDTLLTKITPEQKIKENSTLAIVGTEEQIKKFKNRFEHKE